MHKWRCYTPLVNPNIINMIDVMLIIVVLLLTAATFGSSDLTSMSIQLPDAQMAKRFPIDPFIVEVHVNGMLVANGDVVTALRLQELAAAAVQKHPEITMAVCAENTVTYEQLIRVLDQLHQAGAISVALAAQLPTHSD